MVGQDILLAKIASIRKCLDRIRNVTGGVPESLDHQDTQDIFVAEPAARRSGGHRPGGSPGG
jgi:hypothetical protein